MLSLAALQSPLWRPHSNTAAVEVRSGGATLVSLDAPIAEIKIDGSQATAEVVGDREVLIKGKALGESRIFVLSKDGKTDSFRVVVRSESARSSWTR